MNQITDALIEKAIEMLGVSTGQYTGPYLPAQGSIDSAYWFQTLLARRDQMMSAMALTEITATDIDNLTPTKAFKYVTSTLIHLQNTGAAALEAIKRGDFSQAVTAIPLTEMRGSVAAIYVYNMSGVNLHLSGAFLRGIQAGRISEREALDHLNRCLDICSAIFEMGGKGALSQLKVTNNTGTVIQGAVATATQGLGEPIEISAGILIFIGLVALLLYLGALFIIVWGINQHAVQSKALDQCDKLEEQGNHSGAEACRANVLNASNAPMNHFLEGLLTPLQAVGYTAAVALALYVGVKYIWPAVTEARSAPALGT